MSTYPGLASVRDDFRCSICRQKSVFHCEHDTPYRDQLLGINEQEKPYIISSNSRREPQQIRGPNNDSHTNNSRTTTNSKTQNTNPGQNTSSNNRKAGQNVNIHADGRYQQGQRPDDNSYSNSYSNPYANAYDYTERNETEKKEKSSCVIL